MASSWGVQSHMRPHLGNVTATASSRNTLCASGPTASICALPIAICDQLRNILISADWISPYHVPHGACSCWCSFKCQLCCTRGSAYEHCRDMDSMSSSYKHCAQHLLIRTCCACRAQDGCHYGGVHGHPAEPCLAVNAMLDCDQLLSVTFVVTHIGTGRTRHTLCKNWWPTRIYLSGCRARPAAKPT